MHTEEKASAKAYWRENLALMFTLLSVWALVSFGCGIVFAEELNAIKVGGFKLGFWFSQQGAIYVFVLLIFVYAAKMNKIDRKYNVHED